MQIRFGYNTRRRQEVGPALGRHHCRRVAEPGWYGRTPAAPSVRSAIVVDMEVGASNQLFVRGQGGDLRWDIGQPMVCAGSGTWIWSTRSSAAKFEFQLLLNDEVWERGRPHVLQPGREIHVLPDFEWPEIPRTCSGLFGE